jgi:RimK family alpha-L-glutamate ligase
VVDSVDSHARELMKSFAAAGTRALPVALSSCAIATQGTFGLRIPGFDNRLPDAVLVRSMSGGSFEAVTLRLGILHALREVGVPVWNDARAIERCVDKSMTSFLLARAGIPTPATWATESPLAAREVVRRQAAHGPLVLKPLFGSQGRGLKLVRSEADLPPAGGIAGVYYLQRFVGSEQGGFHDFRLFVSQGRVVAAMARHAQGWITNVKQGGRPVAAVADAEMKELAVRAAAAVGANFAGVDILRGAHGPTVLEVNSMPAWSGLQKVTPFSIASVLAGDLLAALGVTTRRAAM